MNKILIYLASMTVTFSFAGCASDEELTPESNGMASVHGSVTINGEPVNAAAILLTPGGGVKITGSDGMYSFSDLAPGKYEMKVFKEGCQSLNKSIELVADRDEELVFTLAKSVGGLSINKSYVDMGSNESNNVAGFTVKNDGAADISWEITNAARWITGIEPASSSTPAKGATAVTFTIDRNKLSSTTTDNYATLLVRSTTQGDGSVAELLVTVFGTDSGTNTTNDNSDISYVMVGDLYVQTKDISNEMIDWESANLLCKNSTVGDFNDWRLPTIEELATIYNNKRAIGGFRDSVPNESNYWSSTVSPSNDSYNYVLNFMNGQSVTENRRYDNYVRAVRKDVAPEVSILPVSNISESSATFNGRIDNAGSPAYTERGFVYSTSHLPTIDDTKVVSYSPKSAAEFSAEVNNLTFGKTYYIRAYAVNATKTVYSEETTLRIANQLPVVETLPVSDLTETTAVFHGSISSKGIPNYTERGFVYSSAFVNPTIESDEKIKVSGTGLGNYSVNIANLEMGTTYHVRAYAINDEGIAYGEAVSFTPKSPDYVILQSAGLMVQTRDLSEGDISWSSANNLCESSTVGGFTDWRLPTIEELGTLYSNKEKIGDFKARDYWSSDYWIDVYSNYYYYYIDFESGSMGFCRPGSSCYVRAVRSLP